MATISKVLAVLWLAAPAFAELQLDQWRVCAVSGADFQKRTLPPGVEWFWVGHPANSFGQGKIYAHAGPVAYYVHFHLDPFPDNARPLLLVNGLPEGCVVLQHGKPLEQVEARRKGSDAFSVERWYRLNPGPSRDVPGDNARLEIWAPSIRKAKDEAVAPLSVVVRGDPDALAERERQRKLRSPYLHDETEDPYVARHW